MRQDDPYGLAEFGAELLGAKLYKKEKRLVAELHLTRLISAWDAERIAAQLGTAVPECTVELHARDAAALMEHSALPAMLAESWTYFSPLMRPVLRSAVWEREAQDSFAVRIPEKLYDAAKHYNGANHLTEFVRTLYGVELQIHLMPDASLAMPKPEQEGEQPPADMAAQGEPARRTQKPASAKKNGF